MLRNNENTADLTKAEQSVLDLVKRNKAVVKVLNDYNREFIVDQIADPQHVRPSRSEFFYKNGGGRLFSEMERPKSVKKINPKTYEVHEHEFGQCRESVHPNNQFTHTKKTSTTFIPSDPQYMYLFTSAGHIALLWDEDACDLKSEKYLFADIGDADRCPWLDVREEGSTRVTDYDKTRCTVEEFKSGYHSSLDEVRKQNQVIVDNKKNSPWNECIVGLPQGRVEAVVHVVDSRITVVPDSTGHFVPAPTTDTAFYRLETWDFMLALKKKLNLNEDIPVIIIADTKPVRVYTAKDREEDLKLTPSYVHQGMHLFAKREKHHLADFVVLEKDKEEAAPASSMCNVM